MCQKNTWQTYSEQHTLHPAHCISAHGRALSDPLTQLPLPITSIHEMLKQPHIHLWRNQLTRLNGLEVILLALQQELHGRICFAQSLVTSNEGPTWA